MYICDYCKQSCNSIRNVFVVLNLCPDCYGKWNAGELGKKDKDKEEKENEKA